MTEKRSQQKHHNWITVFVTAVLFISIYLGCGGFSSLGYALSGESKQEVKISVHVQRLPDDLIAVPDAQYASIDGLAPMSREAQERQRQAVQQLGLPLEARTRKTGIVFRLVPAGSFTMGMPSSQSRRTSGEIQHQVTLTNSFYCGKFEVTQVQWEQMMGSNPSYFKTGRITEKGGLFRKAKSIKEGTANYPVEQVSWDDCQGFLKKLCQAEGVAEGTYRLLTEAQWEYACRAGTTTAYIWGDSFKLGKCNVENAVYLSSTEWKCDENVETFRSMGLPVNSTMEVGCFAPNGWGLYDMHGNVWEWCQDWYDGYPSGSVTDPQGPRSGVNRVLGWGAGRVNRGGGSFTDGLVCRSAFRGTGAPGYDVENNLGLRIARTISFYHQNREIQ